MKDHICANDPHTHFYDPTNMHLLYHDPCVLCTLVTGDSTVDEDQSA